MKCDQCSNEITDCYNVFTFCWFAYQNGMGSGESLCKICFNKLKKRFNIKCDHSDYPRYDISSYYISEDGTFGYIDLNKSLCEKCYYENTD